MRDEIQTRVKNARAYGRKALNANSANLGLKRVVAFEYHFDVLNNRSEIKNLDSFELSFRHLRIRVPTVINVKLHSNFEMF